MVRTSTLQSCWLHPGTTDSRLLKWNNKCLCSSSPLLKGWSTDYHQTTKCELLAHNEKSTEASFQKHFSNFNSNFSLWNIALQEIEILKKKNGPSHSGKTFKSLLWGSKFTSLHKSLGTKNIRGLSIIQDNVVYTSPLIFSPILKAVQFSCSVMSDSLWPMDCSTAGFPVHHQLPELAQTQFHWVSDAIQPTHPLSSPSPPTFNPSQHQGLFKWVSTSYQVAKVLEFRVQHQSFQWILRTDFLQDWLVGSPCSPRDSQESSPTPQFKSINSSVPSFLYGSNSHIYSWLLEKP